MQTAKHTIWIKQTMLMVGLIIAFCTYPLNSRSVNLSFGNDANSSKLHAITWKATQFEPDDYYVHEILRELVEVVNLKKAFLKDCGCCINDDDSSTPVFLKSDNYRILYILQLLKNKDPPVGVVF
jgi:hypothetical protein